MTPTPNWMPRSDSDTQAQAAALAFEVAMFSDNPAAMSAVIHQWHERLGPTNLGPIAAAALSAMAGMVLEPLIRAADQKDPQLHLRDRIADVARETRCAR